MHPIIWVILGLLYFAINSYVMASVVSEADGRLVRIVIFLFGVPIALITVIALGITTIIFIKQEDN